MLNPDFSSPLDVLVKNFFDSQGKFEAPSRPNVTHPIDVFEDENGLTLEVACTGIDKKDVKISIEGDILRLSYDKGKPMPKKEENGVRYYHAGIKKSNFNLGWKIDSKFSLANAESHFINGLLTIFVPFTKGKGIKTLKIK